MRLKTLLFLTSLWTATGARADCLVDAPTLVDSLEMLQVERFNRHQLRDMLGPYKNHSAQHIRERAEAFDVFLIKTPTPRANTLPFHAALCDALTAEGVSSLLSDIAQLRNQTFFSKLAASTPVSAPLDMSAFSSSRQASLEKLALLFSLPAGQDEKFQALHRQAVEWVYPRAIETTQGAVFRDITLQEVSLASEHFTDTGLATFVQTLSGPTWQKLFTFLAKRRVDNLQALLSKTQAALEDEWLLQDKALEACASHLSKSPIQKGFWRQFAKVCNELFVFPGMHERLTSWTSATTPYERWKLLVSSLQARLCWGDLLSKEQEDFCQYNVVKPGLSPTRAKAVSRAFFKKHFEEEHGAEWADTLDEAFWSRFDVLFQVSSK